MWHYRVRKSKNGFTLVEVIVVTIIVGIIGALAVPSFFSFVNRNRVDRGIAEIEGALREAQKRAIRNGRSCQIDINASANDNTSDNDDAIDNPPTGGGCLLSTRSLPPNNLMRINTNRPSITFSGKGNITIDDSATTTTPRPVIVVYVPNGAANQRRCIVIENSLGSIRTGDYTENPPPGAALAWDDDAKCQ